VSGWENPSGAAAQLILAQSAAGAQHTGDLLETILATIAIPANLLQPNGMVQVSTLWQQSGAGATSPTLRARVGATGSGLGGAVLASVIGGAAAAEVGEHIWQIWTNGTAAGVQGEAMNAPTFLSLAANGTLLTAAQDLTQPAELNITGQLGTAGNTLTLKAFSVIVYPHA
jgi:hypothetical protein